MKTPNRTQSSRLLLRVALAVAESKYPVSLLRQPAQTGHRDRQADGTRESEAGEHDRMPQILATAGLPDALSEGAWQRLEDLTLRFEAELSFADSCLAEDPPRSRLEMLLANSSELRRVAILQRFIERAHSYRFDQPRDGLAISQDVLGWTQADTSPLIAVMRTRALMEQGNFLRILGDTEGAYAALAEAERALEENGTGDPLELAHLQEYLGTLEKDRGNFEAAVDLLRKALTKIRRFGDSDSLQCALIATSLAELYNGNFDAADGLLVESLTVVEPDSHFLKIAAANRLYGHLCSGNAHRAYQDLLRVQSNLGTSWLHGSFEATRTRALWIQGKIFNDLRLDDDALAILRGVRDSFIRLDRGSEVCQISVEMAQNYAAQQRFADAGREIAFALPFCSERKPLDRHAKEAVLLLQGTLQHQDHLRPDQARAVASALDNIHRAPLQARRQPMFPNHQL